MSDEKTDSRPTIQSTLESLASSALLSLDSEQFSEYMDARDELKEWRTQFVHPKLGTIPRETIGDPDQDCIYFLGNSLGLKPKKADRYIQEQMDSWGKHGIFTHFLGRVPAAHADQPVRPLIARLVGAKDISEVTVMNGLTVNLHLFMLAFYKPLGDRNKIVIEDHAFPSDRYAAVSLMRLLGVTEDRLVRLRPRQGEFILRTSDILEVLERERDYIALVLLPGVQYSTGQKLDMENITRFAVERSLNIGWDLAHAAGNVELKLHDWGVDFAVWCSYKYLNSGAGGISGAFLHQKHHSDPPNHLQGWWSNRKETRFEMREILDPCVGVESFRLCNPPPFLTTLHLASLEIFDEVGMEKLLRKQYLLTGYLEYLLKSKLADKLTVLTPSTPKDRGCQLSLRIHSMNVSTLHRQLEEKGVICDTRDDVMRVAPVPLYNRFSDVWNFVRILQDLLADQ